MYRVFAATEFPGLCPSAVSGLWSVVELRMVSDTEVSGI